MVGGLTADMGHRRRAITEAIANEPLKVNIRGTEEAKHNSKNFSSYVVDFLLTKCKSVPFGITLTVGLLSAVQSNSDKKGCAGAENE